MKTTTDLLTGQSFRWNTLVHYCGVLVPGRCTERVSTHLHPGRVPLKLLVALNPGVPVEQIEGARTACAIKRQP